MIHDDVYYFDDYGMIVMIVTYRDAHRYWYDGTIPRVVIGVDFAVSVRADFTALYRQTYAVRA